MKDSDLMKKYNITEPELQDWGNKNYPQFSANKTVLIQLYLAAHNKTTNAQDFQVMSGVTKTISELNIGDWAIINNVAVLMRTRSNSYPACPMCSRKVEGEFCRECGKVEPVTNWFDSYVIGDATGEMPASFGPRFSNSRELRTGQVLKLKGNMNEQGEFSVSMLEVITKPRVNMGTIPTEPTHNNSAATASSPQAAAVAQKSTEELDLQRLGQTLADFAPMALAGVKSWGAAQEPPVTSNYDKMFETLGYEVVNGMVQKKEAPPVEETQAVPEAVTTEPATAETKSSPNVGVAAKAEITPEEAAKADAAKVAQMVRPFGKVNVQSIKKFIEKQGLTTSLEGILKLIPHRLEGGDLSLDATIVVFPEDKGAEG